MKTIKQVADELGTSKTAIRRRLTDDFKKKHTEIINGVIFIKPEGEKMIVETVPERSGTVERCVPVRSGTPLQEVTAGIAAAVMQGEIDALKKIIDLMEVQKAKDDRLIEELSATVREQAESLNADRRNELAGTFKQLALPAEGNLTRWQHLKAFVAGNRPAAPKDPADPP